MKKIVLFLIEIFFAILVVIIGISIAGKYFYKLINKNYTSYQMSQKNKEIEQKRQSYLCPKNMMTIKIPGGKVCRSNIKKSVYQKIFDSYSFKSGGKEQIYKIISEGNIKNANELLKNNFPLERYGTFKTGKKITWKENPYGEKYASFLFYGMRPLTNLFFAFDKTNKDTYLKKAEEIVSGFLDRGLTSPSSWKDYHSVSYRTMTLVKLWWTLRENNLLTFDTNEKLLKGIEKHAEFLSDPNHYDKGYNYGLNEAASLYLVAVNFPDLPNSKQWLNLSKQRISEGLMNIVDKDGVLVENSPYYHFYTMEKYWEIYKYSKIYNQKISDSFDKRLTQMITYGQYILQPDNKIPLLGASISRKISNWSMYKEITSAFPTLKYVLTKGKEGTMPEKTNIVFPESGQVIMRSGWGKERDFDSETQIIFDAGKYRTNHSDFDALSFSLYSGGLNLLPDSGLYDYKENDFRRYFHGTSAHNTITVDDLNQKEGEVNFGYFKEGENYVTASGEHELYKGVKHQRSITLLSHKYIIIFDNLISDSIHTYKQNFHLFPEALIKTKNLDLEVYKNQDEKKLNVLNIYQLDKKGLSLKTQKNETKPLAGICSLEFHKSVPCYNAEYKKSASSSSFLTVLEIGKHDEKLNIKTQGNNIFIKDSEGTKTINFAIRGGNNSKIVTDTDTNVAALGNPLFSLNADDWKIEKEATQEASVRNGYSSLVITTSSDGKTSHLSHPGPLNLWSRNLLLQVAIYNKRYLNDFRIAFSNDNWKSSAVFNINSIYRDEDEGSLLNLSIGKGLYRTSSGSWKFYGSNFDWGKIDNTRISTGSLKGTKSSIGISRLSTIPANKEGKVILVFDDGYESILPAANIMAKYNFPGNTAVIGENTEKNKRGYLSIQQLKMLKDKYKWNIINHSYKHANALTAYVETDLLDNFEDDIVDGEKFLEKNGLNTTPNWYIYPHGESNSAIKKIIAKYYLFARTTINSPETYPFGDPLRVKTISADGNIINGVQTFTPLQELKNSVKDASILNLPLFITFHRIKSTQTDKAGYAIKDFEELMKYIKYENIEVITLKQFDKENNIEQQKIKFVEGKPAQITAEIKIKNLTFLDKLSEFFNNKKQYHRGKY